MKSGVGKPFLFSALSFLLVVALSFALLGAADALATLLWWGCLFLLGLVVLPFTQCLFEDFRDRGYLFGKTIGLALVAYPVWLLSSLRLVPFRVGTVWGAIALVAFLAYLIGHGWRVVWHAITGKEATGNGDSGNIASRNGTLKNIASRNGVSGSNASGILGPLPAIWIRQETILLAALVFWAFLRGLKPELAGQDGQEKFMDYGFMNTILRTDFMPPIDIWFAGKPINYYYFGHYLSAFLTRMSGIPTAIGYNLMMATLFAMAFSMTFSLVANLAGSLGKFPVKQALAAGMISATLLSLGGNLHPIVYTLIFQPNKAALTEKIPNLEVRDNYWFPDATRFIGHNPKADIPNEDMTIHEFPSYSFVISDLHAHVINLPFVLTLLALLGSALAKGIRRRGERRAGIWPAVLLIAFQIGLFQMTNYWDFPIYATVTCAGLFYLYLLQPALLTLPKWATWPRWLPRIGRRPVADERPSNMPSNVSSNMSGKMPSMVSSKVAQPFSFIRATSATGMFLIIISLFVGILCIALSYPLYLILWCIGITWVALHLLAAGVRALPRTALAGVVLLTISLVVARPFSAHLTSLINGIKLVPHHSAFWQLLVIWGQFWVLAAIFCVIVFVGEDRLTHVKMGSVKTRAAKTRTVSKMTVKAGGRAKSTTGAKALQTAGAETYLGYLNRVFLNQPGDVFIFLLMLCAIGLLLLPEIIYIKDIYEGGYVRSNTMFKLTYQSFVLFSICAGYIVARLFSIKYKTLRVGVLRIVAGLVLAMMMMYPFHAIGSWYGTLSTSRYQGLDGSIYLKAKHPDDFAAAEWLKQNASGQPTVLEANGDSYTDYGRISVETGMPTIQGWWTHEWLWRNSRELVAERVDQVNEIYTSEDMVRTEALLNQYDVRYIVIGTLEREKFPNLQDEKLLQLGSVVFEQQSIKILKVGD